jgi:riboflavin kinase/FMN adenylyltransferase
MEAVIIDSLAVSSTNIREHLREGRLDNANKLLGYDYFLRGSVIEGMKIGRIMGYPTANLQPADSGKLIPKNGVYAVKVDIKGELHKAMLYIGTRPTHKEGGGVRTIEANIFDFEDDIYGSTLIIHFLHRLRDDIKYENTDLLSEQIRKDKEDTLRLLS